MNDHANSLSPSCPLRSWKMFLPLLAIDMDRNPNHVEPLPLRPGDAERNPLRDRDPSISSRHYFGAMAGVSRKEFIRLFYGVAKAAEFKSVLARDIQIHFLSCVVGLGSNGETFTRGIADLLLTAGGGGRVETSMNFGLGDWSMPEGMGFWDLQSDAQVDHDNSLYTKNHTDREIAQKEQWQHRTENRIAEVRKRHVRNNSAEYRLRRDEPESLRNFDPQ